MQRYGSGRKAARGSALPPPREPAVTHTLATQVGPSHWDETGAAQVCVSECVCARARMSCGMTDIELPRDTIFSCESIPSSPLPPSLLEALSRKRDKLKHNPQKYLMS